jgi:hypothetical protein
MQLANVHSGHEPECLGGHSCKTCFGTDDEPELMPLEETEIIDQIIPPNEEHRVGLVITDSGAINDPWLRLDLLKKKFNYYVERAMEGGVHPRYRYADPNDFYIEVVCARPPTEQMLQINEVAREGDTKHRLRVLYKELREGIWSETSSDKPVVPVENLATDNLDAIIAAAFEAGHESLRAGEAPLFLLFVKNGQAFVLPMKDLHSDEQVTSALAAWAAENAEDVSVCVLLRFSRRRIDKRTTNVLVARILQAQGGEGFILAEELFEDNGLYQGRGELLFLGWCDNPLIAGSTAT